MTTALLEMSTAIDECILDSLHHGDTAHGVVVPVRAVAEAVLIATGANMEEYQQILRLVCERSIKKGYALAFYGLPARAAGPAGAELFSSR